MSECAHTSLVCGGGSLWKCASCGYVVPTIAFTAVPSDELASLRARLAAVTAERDAEEFHKARVDVIARSTGLNAGIREAVRVMDKRMHDQWCGPACPAHVDPKSPCDFERATEREVADLRARLAAVTAERDAAEGLLERVLALKVLPSARDVTPSISQFARLGVDIESHLRGRTDR